MIDCPYFLGFNVLLIHIYAHFILGMTKQDIARAEGVHEKVVRVAIERGLRRLEKILKNSL